MKTISIIAFVFATISCTDFCDKTIANSTVILTENQMKQDTLISLFEEFIIKVPLSFHLNTGVGDDTRFLHIRKQDETIVMQRESGIGYEDRDQYKTFEDVRKKYSEVNQVSDFNGSLLWLVYKNTNAKFRNISGQVILEKENEIHVLLKFTCTSNTLTEVKKIFKTIQPK